MSFVKLMTIGSLVVESKAVQSIQSIQQFAPSSLDMLPELSLQELQQRQEHICGCSFCDLQEKAF